MINRENFEAFFIDLLEGNLSEEQEKELQDFLVDNPDLAPDNDLPGLSLVIENESFPSKDDIKKGGSGSDITRGNFEQFCIARKEGDLSAQMIQKFGIFLSMNPDLKATASIYDQLKLQADNSIVYPRKQKLRRNPATIITASFNRSIVYRALSVAASVAIIISASLFLMNEGKDEHPGFSLNQETSVTRNPGESADRVSETPGERSDGKGMNAEVAESVTVKPVSSILPETPEKSAGIGKRALTVAAMREPVILPEAIKAGYTDVRVWSDNEPAGNSITVQLATYPVNRFEENQTRKLNPEGLLASVITFVSRNLENETDRDRLNIWDLADAGFKGINFIAGTELSLAREYDENGELVSTEFSSPIFGFQRTSTVNED